MKKAATILLLIICCNSLCYYGYFSVSVLKARLDAKLSLAKIDPGASPDILKIPVSKLQKDESDEVWYDEKLYDVLERDRINDTLYVFLERDEEEQNALARQQECYRAGGNNLSTGDHEVTAIKTVLPISDTESIPNFQRLLPQQARLARSCPAANRSPLSAVFTETPSPPPKPPRT